MPKNTKFDIEYVRSEIEKAEGYKLLSEEYAGSLTNLDIQCPKGHIFKMTWNNFHNHSQRCPACVLPRGPKGPRLTNEHIRSQLEKRGCILLSEYEGAEIKIKIQCPKGHIYKQLWGSFNSGIGCAECSGKKKYTIERVIEEIGDYKLISQEYKNNHIKLKFQCPKGHIFEKTWIGFRVLKQPCQHCRRDSK